MNMWKAIVQVLVIIITPLSMRVGVCEETKPTKSIFPPGLEKVHLGISASEFVKLRPAARNMRMSKDRPSNIYGEELDGGDFDGALYTLGKRKRPFENKLVAISFGKRVSSDSARGHLERILPRCIAQWGRDYRMFVGGGTEDKTHTVVALVWQSSKHLVILEYVPQRIARTLDISSDIGVQRFLDLGTFHRRMDGDRYRPATSADNTLFEDLPRGLRKRK